jgi:catalase
VPDDQNSLTAGERGPVLMQDVHLLEKLVTSTVSVFRNEWCMPKEQEHTVILRLQPMLPNTPKLKFLSEVGKRTEVFVRFSTVGGERGSADTARDVRGLALKFCTEQGNWDLVGNNTQVFFVRDPMKFMDFIHTQKRLPQNNIS